MEQRLQKNHVGGSAEELRGALTTELEIMKSDVDLFQNLLRSFPARIRAVKNAGDCHTTHSLKCISVPSIFDVFYVSVHCVKTIFSIETIFWKLSTFELYFQKQKTVCLCLN